MNIQNVNFYLDNISRQIENNDTLDLVKMLWSDTSDQKIGTSNDLLEVHFKNMSNIGFFNYNSKGLNPKPKREGRQDNRKPVIPRTNIICSQ